MTRRAVFLALVVLAGSELFALPTAGSAPRVGSSIYVVQPDPRLCPSPRCGGYWVQLANRSRTRCADGALYPRCYAARAVDSRGEPHPSSIPSGALVAGTLEPGTDDLGALVVAGAFTPVGRAPATGRYFRVVDRGIRCVRAPCFSLRATPLNRDGPILLSGMALDAAPVDVRKRIRAALGTKSGVFARGRILVTEDGGRVLRASRFYLPSES